MKNFKQRPVKAMAAIVATLFVTFSMPGLVAAQESATVLDGRDTRASRTARILFPGP